MNRIRASLADRCPRCKIHRNFCFCHLFNCKETKTKVSIIMHVSERKLPSNTAWITQQSLQNCSLHVRGEVNHPFHASDTLDCEYSPLFLFPTEHSSALTKDYLSNLDRPIQLIIPDGNWHQAKKVKMREKVFETIPAIHLKDVNRSIYTLRRGPFAGALCTMEAIAYALREIEGEEIFEYLMNILKTMVYRTDLLRRGYTNHIN